MDTLSFILGIALVVVIAVAIVAVYAFVKVGQIREELNSIHQGIGSEIDNQNRLRENMEKYFELAIQEIYRNIDDRTQNIHRIMDSRFDKLDNKFQEQIKK